MATKKQKHAQALARRAEFEAEVKAEGLKALAADREKRKAEEAKAWEDAHKVHLKRNRFHDKCPNCAAAKARQALEKIAKAAALKKAGVSDVDNNILTQGEHKSDDTPIDLSRVEKANA